MIKAKINPKNRITALSTANDVASGSGYVSSMVYSKPTVKDPAKKKLCYVKKKNIKYILLGRKEIKRVLFTGNLHM